MVNPNKHVNNLNEDDLEYIFNRLNKSYEEAEDYNTKKQINQQIIIFLLICTRFSPRNLIRVPYLYFNGINKDDLLYDPLERHFKNKFCQIDGLLLTDDNGQAYTIDDINLLISRIDTGKIQKEVSIETLNKTKSRFNNYGKKSFNKQELKQLNKIEIPNIKKEVRDKSIIKENEFKDDKADESMDNDELVEYKNIDRLSEILSHKVMDKIQLDDNGRISILENRLDEIKEKQDILEDSLSNKHNQLSNTVKKIHQNIKASNSKYNQLDEKFKQLPLIEDKINTILSNQNEGIDEVYNKLEDILQTVEESTLEYEDGEEDMDNKTDNAVVATNTVNTTHINCLKEESESNVVSFSDYKQFMFKWFTNNMKITRNPHDTLDIQMIQSKVDKFIDVKGILLDKDALYNRLESYLKYWYNSYNKNIDFKDMKSVTIDGKEFYGYLKFIDIKQESENRIKNSIITWLKEHTKEVEGAKTYTREIFLMLHPIFEENGWIITDNDEWKELHDAGYTKVCPSRTFSQIIGKSVQEVYESINKDTIQRDTPTYTGFVTWYPNIELIDKEISENVHSMMKNELSDELFDSDNIIYNWLKNNISFTGNENDIISYNTLLERIGKYLEKEEINISDDSLKTIFENIFTAFLNQYNIECQYPIKEICQFSLKEDLSEDISLIISKWLENHLISTDNVEDRVYLEDIHEKLSSLLYSEGLTIVPDDVYSQIQSDIKDNFINQSKFDDVVAELLDKMVTADKVENAIGTYYQSLEIIKFSVLSTEILQDWIEKNVSIINQPYILDQQYLCQKFEDYMLDSNIRNCGDVSTLELLDKNIRQYYDNNSCDAIQVLQDDNSNKFYVGIAIG